MALDPRTPVVVGVGQVSRRPTSADELVEPVAMAAEAARLAAVDSGTDDRLLRRLDSVRYVTTGSWRYRAPGSLVAEAVGATPRQTLVAVTGGNMPQALVDDACTAIAAGDLDVALVVGAEAMYSRRLARRWEVDLAWTPDSDGPTDPAFGTDRSGSHDAEMAVGVVLPTQMYPLFEQALRAAAGESIDDHQRRVAALWARFSEVAATNPYAWSQAAKSPDEIATPSPDNRMIGFPYPKLMNSNIQVDQSAAVLVCSVEAARAAGVSEDRWVFPWAAAEGNDHWFVSERDMLHASPAIAAIGAALAAATGVAIGDVGLVDLYSCFPSAVQIGAGALGFPTDDPSLPLTVTGGLTFAGGPLNNYVTHAIATTTERLRAAGDGTIGLVTALGWFATKHAACLYSTKPPPAPFSVTDVQPVVDATPRRTVARGEEAAGDATVETWTVLHDRDGAPERGIVVALLAGGRRTWAATDAATATAMIAGDPLGRQCTLDGSGGVDIR